MPDGVIAVTGSTGQVGGRVAGLLAAAGAPQRLLVRDAALTPRLPGAEPVRVPGYRDGGAMRRALEGASTLFLVSGRESADRVREHLTAVDAAVAAGVGRIVYLSFLAAAPDTTFTFGRDHWYTEQHIRSAVPRFTFLRDSIYLSMLAAFAGTDGIIRGPAGDGRVSAVAPDDVADVAAAVLLGSGHDGATYPVTGPTAITLYQAAEELTLVTGRPVRYLPETLAEAYASRAHLGAPDFEVAGWVTSYAAIAAGELGEVSDTVARVAGHPAQDFAGYLRAHPESYRRLLTG